ncbi:MAG: hypothetical protein R3Y09_04455 [Clostridia bacterium]
MSKKTKKRKQQTNITPKKQNNAERQAQLELAKKGRKIVTLVVVIDVLYALFSAYIEFSTLALLFNLTISFCIYFGFSFARYLYIFNSVVLTILTIIGYQSFIEFGGTIYLVFMIVLSLWYLFSGYILLKNKAVSAFFHRQQHGE